METEKLVTCPFDKYHRVSQRRLQHHNILCEKHQPPMTKVHCKFNTVHVVDRMEFDHHMATCPSSGHIIADKYVTESYKPIGSIHLKTTKDHTQKNNVKGENWDEVDNSVNSYNPMHNIDNRSVYRQHVGGSKGEKKKFRLLERERFRKLQEESSSINSAYPVKNSINLDAPLRSPRKPARACSQITNAVVPKEENEPVSEEKQPGDINKDNALMCTTKSCNITGQLDQSTYIKETNVKSNAKHHDHEDTILHEIHDNILSMFKHDLSLSFANHDGNTDVKVKSITGSDIGRSTDKDDATLNSTLDCINSRMAALLQLEESISQEKIKLEKQKMSILKADEQRTEQSSNLGFPERGDITAMLMAKYSTGRGFISAHRGHTAFIEKKPGGTLRRLVQHGDIVRRNQQIDDIDKFSDENLSQSTPEGEESSVEYGIVRLNNVLFSEDSSTTESNRSCD